MKIDPAGTAHELGFWQEFIQSERFKNNWIADGVNPELREDVAIFLQNRPTANVLDVGSGVVSILHGLVPHDRLLCLDPLADEYSKIFDYGLHPTIEMPRAVAAEGVAFLPNQFDVVHISNALDHTSDPEKAFIALWDVVRPGGHLIIQGFRNEATHEEWAGFHQWNIDLAKGQLCVTGKTGPTMQTQPGDYSLIHFLETGRQWIVWIKQRL